MIKTIAQAVTIQAKRVAAGKRGYAKAVRRFCAIREREHGDDYGKSIRAFPVAWPDKSRAASLPPRGRAA
mgnify:CR=1 FL=1